MTGITANQDGQVAVRFVVPEGIPSGTKAVEVEGAGGSYGAASYTGQGEVQTVERRTVTTVGTRRRSDPLAQTFTLPQPRHIGGVDLWFTAVGTTAVVAQIREVQLGQPTQQILAEGRIQPAAITTGGAPTRITWPPVWLDAATEYAVVLLTDDPVHEVAVAEMSKWAANAQRWVAGQPYTVGVLLSSSNASTWTAHQTMDLAFRLLGCRFSNETDEVPLGQVTASQASDVIALANIELPASGCTADVLLRGPAGDLILTPNAPVNLAVRRSGPEDVVLRLRGSPLASPTVYPGIQIAYGNLAATGVYTSRQFLATGTTVLTVVLDALLPGGAGLTVEYQDATETWQTIALTASTPIGDGWAELTYRADGVAVDATRIRLTLTGTPAARPVVANLRAVAA